MPDFIFLLPGEKSIRDATDWKKETENKADELEVKKMETTRKRSLAEEAAEEAKKIYLSETEAEFHAALAKRTLKEKHLAICQPSPS